MEYVSVIIFITLNSITMGPAVWKSIKKFSSMLGTCTPQEIKKKKNQSAINLSNSVFRGKNKHEIQRFNQNK